MEKNEYQCLLLSDFTIDNLGGYLSTDKEYPKIKSIVAPFNQVSQILIDENSRYWKNYQDFLLIWTQPASVVKSFKEMIDFEIVSLKKILTEVDEYSSLLVKASKRVKSIFVPTWVIPSYNRGFGMLDMKKSIGLSNTLMQMNLRLAENVDKVSNIFLFNTERWISLAKYPFIPKLIHTAKIAFGKEVFKEACNDIKAAIRGLIGESKKIIIVDLDNTLWGGIVGDIGWENLILGGHNFIGEAFQDFQRKLKSMTNRGILLGIVSKNEETIALEAIKKHPEMVLKMEDFAGWKINWNDKAQNILELVSELNLGLQSVVFIDNSQFERERVKEALPEVFVPDWPNDVTLYVSTFLSLSCFDTATLSKEDLDRVKMYSAERNRKNLKKNVTSLKEWLESLNITVQVCELNESIFQRTIQLINKTNQMNLTTRRITENELLDWVKKESHRLWTFRVSDKFGDSGLTGILSIKREGDSVRIVDFILSCRVMGREIEHAMLFTVIQYTQKICLRSIYAKYIPTAKNKPCLDFLKNSGLKYDNKNTFFWHTKDDYILPSHIELKFV
ncbi:MAG: HAD-IIIC family phosphatase [bacterium]